MRALYPKPYIRLHDLPNLLPRRYTSRPQLSRTQRDARTAAFAAEAHRQSLAVAQSGEARADQDFIDAISDPAEAEGA